MTSGYRPYASSLTVNGKLLATFLCGAAAWGCWTYANPYWQMGAFSIILWIGAFGKLVEALRAMTKIYIRDKEIAAFMAQGRAANSSELATRDALRRAGMTDG